MSGPRKPQPMPFSNPLVPKVADGTKTQTRRLRGLKTLPEGAVFDRMERFPDGSYQSLFSFLGEPFSVRCPYGGPGDQLWVKEQLRGDGQPGDRREGIARYGTDGEMVLPCAACGSVVCQRSTRCPSLRSDVVWTWKPKVLGAMYMPRWASRLTLDVLSVRVERLHDISEEDAKAEGVEPKAVLCDGPAGTHPILSHKHAFADLWRFINGPESWDLDPWVWRIEFSRSEVPHAR